MMKPPGNDLSVQSDPAPAAHNSSMRCEDLPAHRTLVVSPNFAGSLDFFDPDSGARLTSSALPFMQDGVIFEKIIDVIRFRQPQTWTTYLSALTYQEIHAVPFGPKQCILHLKIDQLNQVHPDYHRLFSILPVPLWEMDLSPILEYISRRKHTVQDLYATLTDANDLIVQLASHAIIRQINAATLKLLNIDHDALLPNSIIPFLCHESPTILGRILYNLLENKSVTEITPIRTATGAIVHVALQIIPYPGAERTWKRMLMITQDVTEQYQTIRTLEERNHLLENIASSVPELLWAKDSQARYLFANKAAQSVLYRTRDEADLLGKNDMELAENLRNQGLRHTFGAHCTSSDFMVMQSCQSSTFTEVGEIGEAYLSLEVTKSPLFDAAGRLMGTIGVARDVSKQKDTEIALRQKMQELRLILDNTNDGIWQADNLAGTFQANARFYTLLDYPPSHAEKSFTLREVLRCFIHPEDRHKFIDIIDAFHDMPEYNRPQALRLVTQGGQHKWFSSRWAVVARDFQGNPLQFMGVVTDITREKEREAEEMQARMRAENLSKIKENFLANMSHEIRTPLYGMIGMLQLLESMIDAPEQQHYLRMAVTAGHNLLCIINDVLDFSKMESGRFELFPHPFHLRESLETLIETLQPGALDKKLNLELHVHGDVPDHLFADRARLAQILFNLVSNALKFTESGGVRLEVELIRQQDGEVQLLFSVADTGIGIPSARLDEAFKPYTQLADPAAHRPGTGLGLGIVRNLVALMHGSLVLDSEEGQGTTVSMALTMSLAVKMCHPQPQLLQTPGNGKRVLVVEDDEINLMLLEAMLKKLGHSSKSAFNGLNALKLLEKENFDCILMDVQMPILDGLETTKRIREGAGGAQSIPIIALSAHAMKGDRERFLARGMTDYLSKPVDLYQLGKILSNLPQQNE